MTTWSKPSKSSTTWSKQTELGEGWMFNDANVEFNDIEYTFNGRGVFTTYTLPSKSSTTWTKESK